MFFIDSHCHLDRYFDSRAVVERAEKSSVSFLLSIATSRKNFEKVIALAETYPFVYASAGVHPSDAHTEEDEESLYDWLIACSKHPKVIGIGETGLDFLPSSPPPAVQEKVFQAHVRAALTTSLPLIVHMRQSEERLLTCLEETFPRPTGVLHCFTGSLSCAKKVIDWGWKVSFSGIITFPKSDELRKTASLLPLDSFLLETDAPWLAPQKYRGKENEPAYLIETAKLISDLRSISLETLALLTYHSFCSLFTKAILPPYDQA